MKNIALALMVLVTACQPASFAPDANTPGKKVAMCYSTVDGLAVSANQQVATDRITPDQGSEVLAILVQAKDICTISQTAIAGGRPDDAVAYLSAATLILDKVEVILNGRR